MAETPWQADRDRVERTGTWPKSWGPFHRHFANDAVHRDGGPECDQPGTPRRVYVFDGDTLDEHEQHVARYAVEHPEEFGAEPGGRCLAFGGAMPDGQVRVCGKSRWHGDSHAYEFGLTEGIEDRITDLENQIHYLTP